MPSWNRRGTEKKGRLRNKDVEALVDNQQDSGSMMEDILAAAKTKARQKRIPFDWPKKEISI